MMIIRIFKKLHLFGTYKKFVFFLINRIFTNMTPSHTKVKRTLLNSIDMKIGEGTTIVSPTTICGNVTIGRNCWINRGFTVHGNGNVVIGDNCDIAPEVIFLTGGHKIGNQHRRAGVGGSYRISIGNGCWIGARSTILGDVQVGKGCVVAACSCVTRDVRDNILVAGVPALEKRSLLDGESKKIVCQ